MTPDCGAGAVRHTGRAHHRDLAVRHDAPGDRQIKTLVYVLDGALTLCCCAATIR